MQSNGQAWMVTFQRGEASVDAGQRGPEHGQCSGTNVGRIDTLHFRWMRKAGC